MLSYARTCGRTPMESPSPSLSGRSLERTLYLACYKWM